MFYLEENGGKEECDDQWGEAKAKGDFSNYKRIQFG